MAFKRSSSADTADFTEGIQKYDCAMNLAKIYTRILKYIKINCWRNVVLADKFDMSPEDAEKKSRTFAFFFSQRLQRSYGNRG